jgi:hypothetical protein
MINTNLVKILNARICLIFVYYKRVNEQKNETNLSFFIKHGLNKENWLYLNITYLFIINSKDCEVVIPTRNDIHILKQENCTDYEGWYNGIKYFEKMYEKNIYDQEV